MIPYAAQEITEEDIQSVEAVLRSPLITQGNVVPRFEAELCNYTGAKYATVVNSATSALHLACLALDLTAGDWLWTSPVSFVASANCSQYCGAKIDFVDIDPLTYNLSISALEAKLQQARVENKLPKIVVAVHLAGQSCDMQAIHELSQQYGFKILEDAAHAIGGRYQHSPIGQCQYSDICVFSFHPVKNMTTGEGGAALTNQARLAKKMALLRSHGINREECSHSKLERAPWYYEQTALGFNYRMTDFQAALGISQLHRLDKYITVRQTLADKYQQSLKHLPLTLPHIETHCYCAFHLYIVLINTDQGLNHLSIFNALRQMGIAVNVHYIPIYKQPYYQKLGFPSDYCPNAETYYQQAITLPLYPLLTVEKQAYIIQSITSLLQTEACT